MLQGAFKLLRRPKSGKKAAPGNLESERRMSTTKGRVEWSRSPGWMAGVRGLAAPFQPRQMISRPPIQCQWSERMRVNGSAEGEIAIRLVQEGGLAARLCPIQVVTVFACRLAVLSAAQSRNAAHVSNRKVGLPSAMY